MDRLATRKDAMQVSEGYLYDADGNLQTFTDRKGQVTGLTYDALNRRSQATYAGGSNTTYTYDAGNRLTQIVDSISGTITLTYDNLDRLTQEATPQGTVNYTYDAAGRRSTMTVAGQPIVNYTYDNANRLTQITQGTSTVTFTYDAAGRRTQVALPNGLTENYTYDNASRLTSIEYWNGITLLGNLTYTYDSVGNRTKIGGTDARTGLPAALSSATYNAANRLTNWAGTTLTYDANGNLTNDGANTYTWDSRNRLSSMTGASFSYDALGRRINKTINGVSTGFLYDGQNPVQELSGTAPTANLMTGLGIDQVLTRTDSTGTRSLLTDALGSTMALTDSAGTVQTQYTYEPFGNVSITGTASSNSFQYTGRENDGTGLYYYRARYYNLQIDRFISEDPIGFSSGQTNLYEYVFDNPINLIDPSGLDALNWLQGLSDFSNGAASVLTFGITDRINNALGNSKYVNKCSGWYTLGTGTGIGLTIAIGGAAGAEAAEANAGTAGFEFSHWIPTRFGGPKSIFNGNYVSQEFHYLTDPFRYPPGWQTWGPKLDPVFQQILRVPWVYQGAAAGAAYGGASAMSGRNCGCN